MQAELTRAGLAGVLVDMLGTAHALVALALLQCIKCVYQHHPRPKAFIAQHPVAQQLRRFTAPGDHQYMLVRKQAQQLLTAFQGAVVV